MDVLFRGWSGVVARSLVENVGTGPLECLAKRILDGNRRPSEEAIRWLTDRLAKSDSIGEVLYFRGHTRAVDALAEVMSVRATILPNGLEIVEHVAHEDAIQSPSAARTIDSLSEDPLTAVIYAYGINIEEFHRDGSVSPVDHSYNGEAFVAVVPRDPRDIQPKILEQNIVGRNGDLGAIAQRRLDRDREILYRGVRNPLAVVSLPLFSAGAGKTELLTAVGVVNSRIQSL